VPLESNVPQSGRANPAMTIDELFRRTLAKSPDSIALVDPPNKLRVCGRAPLRLSYAQADRAIVSLAASFQMAGIPPGSIVAMQLPNTVESPLAMLAAFRAGLTVALVPQLWREAELTEALNRISARAILTMSEIDGIAHAGIAMNAAAGAFSVRHVFGFGVDVPDGITPLEMEPDAPAPELKAARAPDIPIITFDVTSEGPRIVPRNHLQVIAGGLAVLLESELPQGATILSTIMPCSFAGLSAGMITWLLSGGELCLHHAFDAATFEAQLRDEVCTALVVPSALALRLDMSARLLRVPHLTQIIGIWRSPEQIAAGSTWQGGHSVLTDVYVFGEAGHFGAQRGPDGKPAPILPGSYSVPRGRIGAVVGELFLTANRTLALRSAMVVPSAYSERSEIADHVDTEYAARLDANTGAIRIETPPPGVLAIGGYRFLARDLQVWSDRLAPGSTLAAQPDTLTAHRLAGYAPDNSRARAALAELGLNPLMVEAFRSR
jgi:hypothetical protein